MRCRRREEHLERWKWQKEHRLHSDEQYARIARNWEGDLCFQIDAEGNLMEPVVLYLDLWHGKCRSVAMHMPEQKPAFIMRAPYGNFCKVLLGQLDPMQALMTRKLQVTGSMAVMMRSVPTVLYFVLLPRDHQGYSLSVWAYNRS